MLTKNNLTGQKLGNHFLGVSVKDMNHFLVEKKFQEILSQLEFRRTMLHQCSRKL